MRALVTGGSGFIGSNVTKKLLEEGYEVRVIDNLSSGHKCNLDNLPVEFILGDINDAETVEKACKGVDKVFHLAACVGRQKSLDDPYLDSQTNLLGTVNVLEGMRKNDISKIVYSSSASIFGELVTPTIDENHPQNADSPYGVSKLAAEKMILSYNDIYGMTGVCLRYFNIYGQNQRYDYYGNVIPIFAKRIFDNQPVSIYGDGLQTRDFLNVIDVAKANFLGSNENVKGVFNLGSGESITINHLADIMSKWTDKEVKIEYLPRRLADVLHCKANITKAQEVLKFNPSVDLTKGVYDYMDWYYSVCK